VFKIPIVGVELQRVLQQFARPQLMPYARFDIDGVENIPKHGPGIIVMNHRSYFDAGAISITIARSGRAVRFLGKKEVFDAPVVGHVASALGGIRVERASGSAEPLHAAVAALEAGELVGLAPQGTIPRGRAFFEPVLKGRWGAARLHQLTEAPMIPIGIWGTEQVWPRSSRLPNVLNITHPPTVRVRVGLPVAGLKGKSLKADTERIMKAIVKQLPPEARQRRTPTPEELALTYPPGYSGDPVAEADRRPGTD
jgi:putative phosphoserine phosphatase / 1-acylglycerol-3-phosphate O-acyltransferase